MISSSAGVLSFAGSAFSVASAFAGCSVFPVQPAMHAVRSAAARSSASSFASLFFMLILLTFVERVSAYIQVSAGEEGRTASRDGIFPPSGLCIRAVGRLSILYSFLAGLQYGNPCILPPPLVDMTNLLCLLSIFTVHSVNGRWRLYLYFSDFFVPANKKGRAAKRTRETPHLPPRKGADVVLTSEWSWNEDS